MTDVLDIVLHRELLAHSGFVLVALAFIVHDKLVLHLRAVMAYCFFVGFASTATGGPIWHLIGWYVLFLAINIWQAVHLARERYFETLSADEKSLVGLVFPALDKCAAKKFMQKGEWLTLREGDVLTEQGRAPEYIYAVLDGEVRISVDGKPVCELGPGQFVGEIGFISNGKATATTTAAADGVRVLAWRQSDLRRHADRSEELRGVIFTALGADLARKVAQHTVRIGGEDSLSLGGQAGNGLVHAPT